MAKKSTIDSSIYITAAILIVLFTVGISAALSSKYSSHSKTSSFPTPFQESQNKDDSTPPLLQSDKGVLFIAAVDKKTLQVHDASIDFVFGNAEPDAIENTPLLNLESYDLYNNHITTQPLPTYDHLNLESQTLPETKKLSYWVISTQLQLPLRTVYWQIRHTPTNKVIWKTNLHVFLLKQSISSIQPSHFVNENSKKMLEGQIQKLEEVYAQSDETIIVSELSRMKDLALQELESNALKSSPLDVDQHDFLEVVDNLLSSIETRNIE